MWLRQISLSIQRLPGASQSYQSIDLRLPFYPTLAVGGANKTSAANTKEWVDKSIRKVGPIRDHQFIISRKNVDGLKPQGL